MSNQTESRQQFESAVIELLRSHFPEATSDELLRGAMLQRGIDGEYTDRHRASEWWAWQASRKADTTVTAKMIEAAESVEDLYKRGTPQTWASVYRAMRRCAPT
jgi:hypothetical protein